MRICGYRLRCLNHGSKCFECSRQEKTENKDYLYDVLNYWAEARKVDHLAEQSSLNKTMPQTQGD